MRYFWKILNILSTSRKAGSKYSFQAKPQTSPAENAKWEMFPALQNSQCVSPIKLVSETTKICKTWQGRWVYRLQQQLQGKYLPVFVKGRSSCVELHTELWSSLANTQPIKQGRKLHESPSQESAQFRTKEDSAATFHGSSSMNFTFTQTERGYNGMDSRTPPRASLHNECLVRKQWFINNTRCLNSP